MNNISRIQTEFNTKSESVYSDNIENNNLPTVQEDNSETNIISNSSISYRNSENNDFSIKNFSRVESLGNNNSFSFGDKYNFILENSYKRSINVLNNISYLKGDKQSNEKYIEKSSYSNDSFTFSSSVDRKEDNSVNGTEIRINHFNNKISESYVDIRTSHNFVAFKLSTSLYLITYKSRPGTLHVADIFNINLTQYLSSSRIINFFLSAYAANKYTKKINKFMTWNGLGVGYGLSKLYGKNSRITYTNVNHSIHKYRETVSTRNTINWTSNYEAIFDNNLSVH